MSAQRQATVAAVPQPETAHVPSTGLPKHRIEGLTDGIYAVAMTLLAIELKLPEGVVIASDQDLVVQLLHLAPRFVAWPLSFAILGIFWFAHQRVFARLRAVDSALVWINLAMLACVTLLPFATMLLGAYPRIFAAHVFYAATMTVLSLLSLWDIHYIHSHPELASAAMTRELLVGARIRCWSLVGCGALHVSLAAIAPRYASTAYMAMALISPLTRRWEAKAQPASRPPENP